MHDEQYKIVAARRQAYDIMLWRAPALAIAAQAFLLAVARSPGVTSVASVTIYFAASAVGVASLYLFSMVRAFEMTDSRLLEDFERANQHRGYAVVHVPLRQRHPQASAQYLPFRAFHVWALMLGGIALISFILACADLLALLEIDVSAHLKRIVDCISG